MSSKNKIANKSIRRSERAVVEGEIIRTPVSQIAQKTSARLLAEPKKSMVGSVRRRLQRSRGMNIGESKVLSGGTGSPPEVVFALRLQALPLVKLIRRLKQACRRAATCRFIIDDLAPDSKYAASLKAEQTHQLTLAGQIHAEISCRNHNP